MLALTILVLGLAAVRWQLTATVAFEAAWLVPPAAAWLVQRFGRAAIPTTLAMLALVVFPLVVVERGALVVGGRPDVALVALGCLWLAHRGEGLRPVVDRGPLAPAWIALPLALPVFVVLPLLPGEELKVTLSWGVLALLTVAAFVAGLRGAAALGGALGLAAAIALGATLALLGRGRFEREGWVVAYSFIQPYSWLSAALAWFGGAAVRRAMLGDGTRGPRAWPPPVAVAALLLSVNPNQFGLWLDIPVGVGQLRSLSLFGAAVALPLAGLLAGALGGLRGAWTTAGLALLPPVAALGLLWWSDGQHQASIGNALGAPIVLAWGWLGARLAGHATAAPSLRLTAVTLLAAVAALALLADRDGGLQLALSLAAAVATAVVGGLISRFAARVGVTGAGWVPVLLLPVYGLVLAQLGGEAIEALFDEARRLAADWPDLEHDELVLRVATVAAMGLTLALLLREVVRGMCALPKILRDLRSLAGAVRAASGWP